MGQMKNKPSKLYKVIAQSLMARKRFIVKYSSLSGVVSSSKNGTGVWFESSLEKDFALLLEYHPAVSHYVEQSITIEFNVDEKTRVYTPDFLVFFKDDAVKPWLCEIKYRDDFSANFHKYKAKFKAAVRYCAKEDWEFKLISEQNIRTPLLENLTFLNQYEKKYIDRDCYKLVINRIKDLGNTTPREVLASLSDANQGIYAKCIYALWYGLKSASVGCDYSKSLTIDTEIWKQ